MTRITTLLVLMALVAAPLAACGKKGDPESDPPQVKRQMPPPQPPPNQPAPNQPPASQPKPTG